MSDREQRAGAASNESSANQSSAKARGFGQVKTHEIDVVTDAIPVSGADAAWARWIFAFLPRPKEALKKFEGFENPIG